MSKARVVKQTNRSKTAAQPKRVAAAKKKPVAKRKPAATRKPATKKARAATKPAAKTTKRAAKKPAVKATRRAATKSAAKATKRAPAKASTRPAAKPARPVTKKPPTARPAPALDLFKLHRDQYATPKTPVILETQPAQYLAIAGQGMPGGEAFMQQMGALYSIAYTIRMTRKFSGGGDYKVGMLEALWWHDHPGLDFDSIPADELRWELLIRTPDFVTVQDLTAAVERLEDKDSTVVLRGVRLITMTEGTCVQMLHVGPYDRERESIARMVDFARAQGHTLHGRHHEIYMSDPRRMAPEKLRTILRLPVRKSGERK